MHAATLGRCKPVESWARLTLPSPSTENRTSTFPCRTSPPAHADSARRAGAATCSIAPCDSTPGPAIAGGAAGAAGAGGAGAAACKSAGAKLDALGPGDTSAGSDPANDGASELTAESDRLAGGLTDCARRGAGAAAASTPLATPSRRDAGGRADAATPAGWMRRRREPAWVPRSRASPSAVVVRPGPPDAARPAEAVATAAAATGVDGASALRTTWVDPLAAAPLTACTAELAGGGSALPRPAVTAPADGATVTAAAASRGAASRPLATIAAASSGTATSAIRAGTAIRRVGATRSLSHASFDSLRDVTQRGIAIACAASGRAPAGAIATPRPAGGALPVLVAPAPRGPAHGAALPPSRADPAPGPSGRRAPAMVRAARRTARA